MPFKPELKYREYDAYKMYYCGVCKSIGRNFGQLSRFGLVYEAAILAILLDVASCNIVNTKISRAGCIAHPYKKSFFVENSDCVDYAAAVNVLLMYFKLQDNWQDDRKFSALSAKAAIKRGFKKASKKYEIAADSIYISINQLNKLEKNNCSSIDEASEPFAAMMSSLFKWLDNDSLVNNNTKLDLLGKIGYNVGKWIYLIDAVSDFYDDKKKGSYNVLLKGDNTNNFSSATDDISFTLQMCMANAAEAYQELIRITDKEIDTNNINYINAKGVIDNLLYVGIRHITDTKVGKLHESV